MSARWNAIQSIIWIMGSAEYLGTEAALLQLVAHYASSPERGEPSLALTLLSLQRAEQTDEEEERIVPGLGLTTVSVRGKQTGLDWTGAQNKLVHAIRTGFLEVSGRASTSSKYVTIAGDECEFILLRNDLTLGPYATLSIDLATVWTGLRFSSSDIRSTWPVKVKTAIEPIRTVTRSQRGRKPEQGDRVRSLMRAVMEQGENLASWKEEELASHFKASRDTCRRVRKELLSKIVEK